MTRCDVAIAGGGPAGTTAAIVLARAGVRVLLADAGGPRRHGRWKIGEGLPPSARSLLAELGVLHQVLADGHRASHGTLAYWGADTPHADDAIRQLHGTGLQLDRVRFDAMLLEHARDAGVRVVTDATLSPAAAADAGAGHPLPLVLRAGDTATPVLCRWRVDASGRAATLARRLGARRIRHDGLVAFHMRLAGDGEGDRDGRTWVEAVADGWWYSVLLPSGGRLVAFLSDADLVDRRALLSREGLWAALGRAPRLAALCRAHGYAPVSDPQGDDACGSHLERAAGTGWIAVGDAALAFDPLSSKGIANALYTGLQGARALLQDEDRGDDTATRAYAGHLLDIHRVYRQQLRAFHALETRWPRHPFWQRRMGACTARHAHDAAVPVAGPPTPVT